MWKSMCVVAVIVLCTATYSDAGPVAHQKKNMPIMAREDVAPEMASEPAEPPQAKPIVGTLTLPSNATSIRAEITDNFSCANKTYGYYADVENDCQIFHVCLPVTYADGKENIFRWSFICPEETIFSQESFTCMRREDMTIDCEDSFRYYELNGNFGMPAEEQSAASEPAMIMPAAEKPNPMENETEEAEELKPMPVEPKPVEQPKPPVKVQKPKPKPNRRKPAITYTKPQPQRKVPTVVTPATEVIVEEPIEPIVAAHISPDIDTKPLKPHRFSARPNKPQANKEQSQVVKVVVTPPRTELFNSNRKRPAVFNKISATSQPEEVSEAVTEAVVIAELNEPKPTLKLETMFSINKPEQDSVAEASDAAEIIVKPDEVQQATNNLKDETELQSVPVIEAIEEIPAVIVETMEKQPIVEESKPTELKEEQPSILDKADRPNEPSIFEPSNSGENIEALEAEKPADAPESLPATEEMAEPNPLIEEMLDSGSSDSSTHDKQNESLGGFKPVDPVMAAEAEQLITDFINTLRKSEENMETAPALVEEHKVEESAEEETPVEAIVKLANEASHEESAAVSVEEAKLPESDSTDNSNSDSVEEQSIENDASKTPSQQMKDSPITNIVMLSHQPTDEYQIPVQIIQTPESEPEPQSAAEAEAVVEEKEEEKLAENSAPEDSQHEAQLMANMPPISIDDIVELVKERLDQSPKNEQLAPMELVLTPGGDAPMALIQSSTNEPAKQNHEVPEKPAEEEQMILPIYNRIDDAEPTMTKVQTVPVTATRSETGESQVARQPKASRNQFATANSGNLDARKRRFLFRADAHH